MENRFAKQQKFYPIGTKGQEGLAQSTVAIIGCGALGSAAADTLARAGVGRLLLVDRDYVEVSNLHRQPLYTEADARDMMPKVEAAKKRLAAVNSEVSVETWMDHADATLIEGLAQRSDLLIDGTDNFETRLVINDASVKHGIPWIYGACVGATSVVMPFIPGEGPCFRCLLPVLPSSAETCDTAGVIAPAVYITAAFQCAEALKWLTGNADSMRRDMLRIDAWTNEKHAFGVKKMKRPDCPSCGAKRTYPALSRSDETKAAFLCGRDTIQLTPGAGRTLTLEDGEKIARKQQLKHKRTPYFLQIMFGEHRIVLFQNGRLFFHGMQDAKQALKIYNQLFS
ncbi:ThiF family adenylyltransferase [Domibacillus sp. DTU_2020_1001157_1_SI_ALB_TIR_016]|uniref:ThiF family adenylyltransferase n=1 Tax=Domibacillus sp. DTU_2020_1001157_1_SI_ALB_TIR_016 TaxID=3077789 RepID=UPI0028ED7645|nr:ThiF family adenylyltransferase [Domibacillus sp. DTU_2020_1001157_1_SI_ALB_TIR_016]WNS80495.1 ThiF family adenylyltransferase [Domibacillus sp. DTU_2020_1001157_1_SI_ALB_TIR_016]